MSRLSHLIAAAALFGPLLGSLHGCETDGAASAVDVVEPDENGSAVDTLVLLLSVQLANPRVEAWEEYDGYYVDCRQIEAVGIAVDAGQWGVFAVEPREASPDSAVRVEGWSLQPDPCQALLVAELGRESNAEQEAPKTVGQWVSLLRRYLSPGGHVGEILQVRLESAGGVSVELRPGELLPFKVSDGDTTSFLGEVLLQVDGLGGES